MRESATKHSFQRLSTALAAASSQYIINHCIYACLPPHWAVHQLLHTPYHKGRSQGEVAERSGAVPSWLWPTSPNQQQCPQDPVYMAIYGQYGSGRYWSHHWRNTRTCVCIRRKDRINAEGINVQSSSECACSMYFIPCCYLDQSVERDMEDCPLSVAAVVVIFAFVIVVVVCAPVFYRVCHFIVHM